MADPTPLPVATPKRKRDDLTADMRLATSPTPGHAAKTIFSFQPPTLHPTVYSSDPTEDGNSSPRSKVAQKFRDLAITESGEGPEGSTSRGESESGGGATGDGAAAVGAAGTAVGTAETLDSSGHKMLAAPDLTRFNFDAGITTPHADMQLDADDEDTAAARKRPKTFELDIANPGSATNAPLVDNPLNHHHRLSVFVDSDAKVGKSGSLQKSYPSINRLMDSKSRSRKRTGTPPPSSKKKGNAQSQSAKIDEEEEIVIVDPVRAALTWHEDEITVYDPDDKDDDGTGINGIGFKPTAAVAYRRAQKRRQQLAEYKKREESEARARRNQRRREQLGGGPEIARRHSIVRVHFSDAPPTTVMTT
ncbi:hypothetical protein F5Y01DRAFT_164438 [Xylaria sp. FL0043]|nr:hypothetical protein F5Y01DRAFT_164438 [Xylaria sp. FL0043]